MWFLPLLFLVSILLNGALVTRFVFGQTAAMVFWATSFVLGAILSAGVIFLLTIVFSFTQNPLLFAVITYFVADIIVLAVNKDCLLRFPFAFEKYEVLFFATLSLFFAYIFFRSFSYDAVGAQLLISSNTYLDFGVHLPIIRSFSLGHTASLTLPFFAGQTVVYHFMFDFLAGIFEFLGAGIDWAFNLMSVLSFLSLAIFVFNLALFLFKSYAAAVISVILVLFNGTLTFVLFLKNYSFGLDLISKIRNYNVYLDNGPFGQNPVSIFWNLNTYLNQRHFIFALAFFFCLVYVFLSAKTNMKKEKLIILGILVGVFPLWHMEIFLMSVIFIVGLIVVYKNKELFYTLLAAVLLAVPQLLMVKLTSVNQIVFNSGFLLSHNLNLLSLANYWVWNLGFYIPAIIISYFLLNKTARKLFFLAFIFFVLANIFQFTREMFNNHKFLNVWIIFMAVFVSYVPVFLWRKNNLGKILATVIFCLLTASGFLSFFVIKNDVFAKIPDYKNNKFLTWVMVHSRSNEIFLTNGDIFDPVTLAGRKTFLGRTHFVWAYGGNPDKRLGEEQQILNCQNILVCNKILYSNRVAYIVIYNSNMGTPTKEMIVNTDFLRQNYRKVYEDKAQTVFSL